MSKQLSAQTHVLFWSPFFFPSYIWFWAFIFLLDMAKDINEAIFSPKKIMISGAEKRLRGEL
ncbi:hypothetical protein L209DRAFT_448674 [Thermothelomyces heterothallicus CBS 203.75]